MANYFTDKDEETKALIDKCTEGQSPEVKAAYLVNCLTLKYLQDKTIKEVFEAELKCKERVEDMKKKFDLPMKPIKKIKLDLPTE